MLKAKKTRKRAKKAVNRTALKGRGDYSLEVKQIVDPVKRMEAKLDHVEKALSKMGTSSNLAGKIGRTLGNFVGQGELGSMAGEGLSKLFGHGDYEVKANSVMHAIDPSGPVVPKFSTNKRGIRVTEREFIGDIASGALLAGSSVFTNVGYNINPSNRVLFPWLSALSSQFDQWRPFGVVFEFVSSSSEFNGTSQALGTVVMATDYDPTDANYTGKQQMENADFACSTKPSRDLMHGIECDPKERPIEVLYTDTTGLPQFNSLGTFQIATVGCSTASAKLGELWVSYDIEFYKKQFAGFGSNLYYYQRTGAVVNVGANMLGLEAPGNSVSNGNWVVTIGQTIAFPPDISAGTYLFTYKIVSGTVTEGYFPSLFIGCIGGTPKRSNEAATSNTFWMWIKVTAPNATVSWTTVKASSGGTAEWIIAEVNNNIL